MFVWCCVKGMLDDLSTYELEDIWDEFCHIDDHIVPHSRDESACGHASQPKSCKKPRIEVNTADAKCPAKCFSQEKEEIDSSTVNLPKLTMSESGMWTYRPDGTFSFSCDVDPTKDLATLASANTKTSSSCFQSNSSTSLGDLCSDDTILSSRSTAVHSSSYGYPLHTSQAENDLSYMDIPEDESSDLLYYSWDDVGFEDVFRNCDSLFNLQSKSNGDDIGWLSASNAFEGSESASGIDFVSTGPDANALKNPPEDLAPSKLKTECSSANDTDMTNVPASNKTSPQLSEVEDATLLSCISVANTSNETAEIKENIVLRDQEWNIREGMINDQHKENGDAFRYPSDLWIEGKYLSSEVTSHNDYTTICVQQHKENLGADTLHHLCANVPRIQSDRHQSSDQTTISPSLSGTRLENNSATSLTQKESLVSLEVINDKDCSHDLSSMMIDVAPKEGRDNPCHYQGLQASSNSNAKNVDVESICNTFPVQASNEFENHSDVEGTSRGIPAKVGPWYVQESPTVNSGFNEGSLEATSFRQLQQVMEQLDLRTKLCIRDSLYRLARSAEQRHINGGPGGDRDARTFMADGTNKSSGYIDIEADTNPIDRSVAHLLFHRPSVPLRSQSIIPTSVADPPIVVEKNNESAVEMDRKVAISNDQ
ncbi:protein LNK1 isoform X2 [Apium graveolens]|uniref:protein LNK1 isoform X2 n=1 Tax=Apium graveolens TaxID=4045 RepID=UPI003D7BBD26